MSIQSKLAFKLPWHTLLLWLVWFVIGVVVILGARKHALSLYFEDETDHVAVGAIMFEHHRQLYDDIVTIHQPLPVLIGGVLANFTNRATMFAFISQLRLLMSLLWFATGCVLVLRFRWLGLATGLGFGIFSYAYFGFYVLPEALVFPALGLIILLLAEKLFHFQLHPAWWSAWLDWILYGLSCFYLIFNLLPSAIFILATTIVYLILNRQKWLQIALFIASSFFLASAALFLFINPLDWWQNTIVNLILYWFPTNPTVYSPGRILTALFHPFAAHWWLVIALMLGPLVYLAIKKKWRSIAKLSLLYFLAASINTRITEAGEVFWRGFHLLPYLVVLSSWIVVSWKVLLQKFSHLWLKIAGSLLLAAWLVTTGYWLWAPDQRQSNYEIIYLPQQAIVNVLNILKEDGDTLFTGAGGAGYLNLLADLPFADKQNFHLAWGWETPSLRQNFYDVFANSPPTFIYYTDRSSEAYYSGPVGEILHKEYTELLSPGGNPSNLYVHTQTAATYSPEKWQKFSETLWEVQK